jgi:hypothetical protein
MNSITIRFDEPWYHLFLDGEDTGWSKARFDQDNDDVQARTIDARPVARSRPARSDDPLR